MRHLLCLLLCLLLAAPVAADCITLQVDDQVIQVQVPGRVLEQNGKIRFTRRQKRAVRHALRAAGGGDEPIPVLQAQASASTPSPGPLPTPPCGNCAHGVVCVITDPKGKLVKSCCGSGTTKSCLVCTICYDKGGHGIDPQERP